MNEIEKAYLAGIVDGEGYIGVARYWRNDKNNYYLKLQIQLTNEKLIKYLSSITNHKVTGPYKYGNRQEVYSLSILGKRAATIITNIAPYLVGKAVQAELADLFPIRATAGGGSMDADTKDTQSQIYEEMKMLNNKS